MQLISANSTYDSLDKQKIVACPGGRRVLGAAGHLEAPLGRVMIDDLTSASTLTIVGVTAFEDKWGVKDSWYLTAQRSAQTRLTGFSGSSRPAPATRRTSR